MTQYALSGFVTALIPRHFWVLSPVRYVGCRIYARGCQDYASSRHLYYSRTPVPPGLHTNRDIPSITSQPAHYEDIRGRKEDEAFGESGFAGSGGGGVWAEVLALLRPT